MNKTLLALVPVLLLASTVMAAADTVMLVTDITSADAATASAAAEKAGVPVLVLEGGVLSDTVRTDLMAYKNVVIVGGPSVIKKEVETELLQKNYSVVRIWGFERTGTAIAVARYFWPEGAGCAVLVDDTKDSDADTRRLIAASNLAARFDCAMLPVPEGSVPADVLDLLKEMGVTDVHFVGKRSVTDVKERLHEFRLREEVGSDDDIEGNVSAQITNNTGSKRAKLVIIATPDWKAAVAFCAHPNGLSVVRHVASENDIGPIVDLIKERNITDIKVVGIPDLAKRIADALAAQGINATQLPGAHADELVKRLINATRQEWEQKKADDDTNRARFRIRIKASLETQFNETLERLDASLAELEAMENNSQTQNVVDAINMAKARIVEVRALITSGDFEGAKRLMFSLRFKADEKRLEFRDALKIKVDDEIQEEENDLDDEQASASRKLGQAQAALMEIKSKCANSDIAEAIVEKARMLNDRVEQASSAGNYTGAAKEVEGIKELLRVSQAMRDACAKHGKLPGTMMSIRERRGITVENKTEGPKEPRTLTVDIFSDGFRPRQVNITLGDTVEWTNRDNVFHAPASNLHPTHTVYPGSSRALCNTQDEKKIFDACDGIGAGETYSFTFNRDGRWQYHDHLNPELTASVNVIKP